MKEGLKVKDWEKNDRESAWGGENVGQREKNHGGERGEQ